MLLLVPVACMLIDVSMRTYRTITSPCASLVLREMEQLTTTKFAPDVTLTSTLATTTPGGGVEPSPLSVTNRNASPKGACDSLAFDFTLCASEEQHHST